MTYLCPNGDLIVTFDPLDGSSVIDTNCAVGSIFAIWNASKTKKTSLAEPDEKLSEPPFQLLALELIF